MKAALYCRVSTDEQVEGYSLDAQLRACRALCTQRGWQIAAEYVEEGKSAHVESAKNRPQFRAMLAAVDARQMDVVVVHKLDRFSRHQRTTLDAIERMGKANAALVSVTESFDYSTPSGRLFFHMFAAFADFFSANLATESSKGKQERKRQGLYNGILPFGYKRRSGEGRATAIVDEEAAKGVRLAFRLAGEGVTVWDIAKRFNALGYRTHGTSGDNPWPGDSVRYLLHNRFYLGELPGGVPGTHTPLVTPAEFEAAQAAIVRRAGNRRALCVPNAARRYSVTGVLTCGKCGGRMNVQSSRGYVRVYCARRRLTHDCDQPSATVAAVESVVETWIGRIADSDIDAALDAIAREQGSPTDADGERKRIGSRMERLKRLYLMGDISEQEYRAERDELVVALASLPKPAQDVRLDLEATAAMLADARSTWQMLSQGDRNTLLLALVEKIILTDERVDIVPRPEVARLLVSDSKMPSQRSLTSDLTVRLYPRYCQRSTEEISEIAATARDSSIIAAARLHRVSRQTVRRALGYAGHP